jgi:enamine deaminase RidA (YjgF/YER057c/UK114 family)
MDDPHIGPTPEQRLAALGLTLPRAREPIANYVGVVREGDLLFVSGQGPVSGAVKACGKVGRDVDAAQAYEHAKLTGLNLMAQIKEYLGSLDHVSRVVKLLGFVNAAEDFADHPDVINGCSDLFVAVFGPEIGRHARSAIGVSSLPGNITVEIEAVVAVKL